MTEREAGTEETEKKAQRERQPQKKETGTLKQREKEVLTQYMHFHF